jgi:hypothetical protein
LKETKKEKGERGIKAWERNVSLENRNQEGLPLILLDKKRRERRRFFMNCCPGSFYGERERKKEEDLDDGEEDDLKYNNSWGRFDYTLT